MERGHERAGQAAACEVIEEVEEELIDRERPLGRTLGGYEQLEKSAGLAKGRRGCARANVSQVSSRLQGRPGWQRSSISSGH